MQTLCRLRADNAHGRLKLSISMKPSNYRWIEVNLNLVYSVPSALSIRLNFQDLLREKAEYGGKANHKKRMRLSFLSLART